MENNNNPTILNLDLSQYVSEIRKLRQEMSNLVKDSKEYLDLQDKLREKNEALRDTLKQAIDTHKEEKTVIDSTKDSLADAKLEANEYANSIDGIKLHIRDLTAAANKMDVNSDEFKKTTAEIKNLQDSLKSLKGDTAQARLEANDYADTLNGLRAKYKDLIAAIADMPKGAEATKKMTDEALKLRNEISGIEESYGVFSRNVGNYANAFKEAFSDMSFSMDNITNKAQQLDGFLTKFKNNFVTGFKEATKDGKTLSSVIKGLGSGIANATKNALGLRAALAPLVGTVGVLGVGIAALLAAFSAIKMSIQNDEESTDKWKESLSELRATVQVIKNLFQDWGKSMSDVITPVIKEITSSINGFIIGSIKGLGEIYEFLDGTLYKFKEIRNYFGDYFVTLAKWTGGFTPIATFFGTIGKTLKADGDKLIEQAEEYEAIRQRQIQIDKAEVDFTKLKRANLVELAKLEVELYEIKEKAADKEHYSADERLQYLNEAKEIELQMLSIKETEAKIEWDILKLKAEQGTNSSEDNDKLAEAEANYIKAKAESAKKELEYTKQSQRIIAERQSQLKEELQFQIRYWQTVQKNNKETSDKWKEAKLQEYKLQYRLTQMEIKESKAANDVKLQLLKELEKEYQNQISRTEFDFNFDVLDEKYKELITKINELPEKTVASFDELEVALKKYRNEYLNTLTSIADEVPTLNIGSRFLNDIQGALKDMSQNWIPITVENLKKYFDAVGRSLTADQEELFKRVESKLGVSFNSILTSIQKYNQQIEDIEIDRKVQKLTKEISQLEQNIRTLDSTYRKLTQTNEVEWFTSDVTKSFTEGQMSLRGYLTELARFTDATMAQGKAIENQRDRLKELKKAQEENLKVTDEAVDNALKKLDADNNDVNVMLEYKKAVEEQTKAQKEYNQTLSSLTNISDTIEKINNIRFNFSFEDIDNISTKISDVFYIDSTESSKLTSEASEQLTKLYEEILTKGLSNDDIDKRIAEIRKHIVDEISNLTGVYNPEKANEIFEYFIPNKDVFKEKAQKAFSEVEQISYDHFSSVMKWYDESNKKITQSYNEIFVAQTKLEREMANATREETVEQRQQRIYLATVEYEQKILDWEKTFFEERRKQQEETHNMRQTDDGEYTYMFQSKKQINKAFKEEKKALDEVYNERNEYLVRKIKVSEELQKDIKKELKKATTDEEKESLQAELDTELTVYAQYNQEKLALDTSYNEAKQEIESNYEELRKQFKLENDPIEVLKQEIESEKEILDEWFNEKLQLYADNEEKLLELKKEYAEKRTAIARKEAKQEDMTYKRNLNTTQKLADGTGKIIGQIAQYYEEDLEQKQRNGDITEEEAKKQFEVMKGWQIAAAVVDTLRGGLGIYMGTMADSTIQPSWLRFAMAGLGYATTLASGFLTIKQIESTRFGDGSSSAGGANIAASAVSYQPVTVKPLLDEQADMGSYTNVSASPDYEDSQELRVTILESDIQESNARVAMRQSRTSF